MFRNILLLKICVLAFFLQGLTWANAQTIPTISADPTIDGVLDVAWNAIPEIAINNVNSSTTRVGDANYNPKVRIAAKGTKLYFFFNITDNDVNFTRGGNPWTMDFIAIHLNFNPANTVFSGNAAAHQYRFNFKSDAGAEQLDGRSAGNWGGTFGTSTLVTKLVTGGYTAEVSMDLSSSTWAAAAVLTSASFTMDIQCFDSGSNTNLFSSVNGTTNDYDNVTGYSSYVFPSIPISSINVYQLTTEPTIDGIEDAAWASLPSQAINQRDLSDNGGVPRTPDANFGATYKIGWRGTKLYFLFNVTDNVIFFNNTIPRYDQDNVSVFMNLASTHLTDVTFSNNSTWYYQAAINQSTNPVGGYVGGHSGLSNSGNGWGWPTNQNQFPTSQVVTKSVTGGYIAEIAFDFSDTAWGLSSPLVEGKTFGLDVGADDVEVLGGARQQLFWSNSGKGNNAYQNVSGYGVAIIKSSNGFTQFRSKTSGNWSDISSWESSKDGTTWIDAFSVPNQAATQITVASANLMTIIANANISAITLQPGARLTLNSGTTLTVSSLTLNSDATGTGTFVDNNTTNPQAITATVKQYLTSGRNWYVASPISGATTANLNTAASIVYYNEPTGTWLSPSNGATLSPLRGYISTATTGTGTVTFTGTLNTGVQSIALSRTGSASKPGFNLVGNPYPSYLNWNMATKTNLETSYWYRTKTAANAYTFDTYNATGGIYTNLGATTVSNLIPPMQAFWVRVAADQTSGTLSLTNSMRSHYDVTGNKLKVRSEDSEQKVLRLQITNGTNKDEAVIYFDPNASNGFDDYDSPKMSNANKTIPEIYTIIENEELVINGLTTQQTLPEIDLGFRPGESNNFTLNASEIKNFDADIKVILNDKLLKTEQDITDGTSYMFKSDSNTTNSRFSIIFKTNSVATNEINIKNDNGITIYKNANNKIIIDIQPEIVGKGTVSVYNAVGEKLEDTILKNTNTILNKSYSDGLYLINVKSNGKSIVKKIIIYETY